MIKTTCAPGCAFSVITWVFINQSRHKIHQMKAGYLSYLNVGNSFNIEDRELKYSMVIQVLVSVLCDLENDA